MNREDERLPSDRWQEVGVVVGWMEEVIAVPVVCQPPVSKSAVFGKPITHISRSAKHSTDPVPERWIGNLHLQPSQCAIVSRILVLSVITGNLDIHAQQSHMADDLEKIATYPAIPLHAENLAVVCDLHLNTLESLFAIRERQRAIIILQFSAPLGV